MCSGSAPPMPPCGRPSWPSESARALDARSIRAASSAHWRDGKKNGGDLCRGGARRPRWVGGGATSSCVCDVLAGGTAPGGHCGLVVLRREGLAAWMAWRTTGAAAPELVTATNGRRSAPLAADDLHASLVRVLASMAMSAREERSR